jgi:hypothetical protein
MFRLPEAGHANKMREMNSENRRQRDREKRNKK